MDSEPQPKMDPDQLLSLLIESLSNIDQNINNPDPLIQNLESLLDSHGSVLNELSLDPALIQDAGADRAAAGPGEDVVILQCGLLDAIHVGLQTFDQLADHFAFIGFNI